MKKQLPIIVLSGTLILIALVTIQNFSAMKTQSAQKAGEACPITQSPICGSDNTTYDNACIASKKGIGFQYQ
jgi:hypothetical protein